LANVSQVREARNPASIHAPFGAYSHQIELRGPERMLVLSGQVGVTPDGSVPDDTAEQFDVALANVLRNLEAASMEVGDLIKMTLYFVEPVDAERRRAILQARLGHHEPCMTLLYVAGLSAPAIKTEIDAWASTPGSARG
jgi:enamine deaminase RidA (YjgF/YER057c/UK114 family)